MLMHPLFMRRKSEFSSSRRQFLQKTGGAAAGAALLNSAVLPTQGADRPPALTLPTIRLGKYSVSRLIIGGNPIYGHSHFNRLLSEHLRTWHTPERVMELLRACEQQGINTWQNSYATRTLADLEAYREQGGKLQWLCLGKGDWDQNRQALDDAARRKPIGIAPHGSLAERLHRLNRIPELTDLLKRIRDKGVLVGLSAHNPQVIELAEEKGWDVDYYMCCLYYLTRPAEEFKKLMAGEVPLGEVYLPSDPPKMFKVIQATRKPCLAYKVLAAGRRVENPAQVSEAFKNAFRNIKPTDAIIVGMFQQLNDQVTENASLVRSLLGKEKI